MTCSIRLHRILLPPMMALLFCFTPLAAQEGADAPESTEELSRAERKQRAKQARVDEYLRNKEARLADKEQKRAAQEAARAEVDIDSAAATTVQESDAQAEQLREAEAEQIEAMQLAEEQAAADEAKTQRRAAKQLADAERASDSKQATPKSNLPRDLAVAQTNVRATDLGDNETVQEYLDLVDRQAASPDQLAAFGSFLAQNGLQREALEYYKVALRLDPKNPVLWINQGTLLLQSGEVSAAAGSFNRALAADPNNAVAHYNMGAALDELNRYDDAVAAYTTALLLDPELGDPSQNPQAANNDLLLAVRLMLFQKQTGSLSVPMIDIETGKLAGAIKEDDDTP